MSERYFIFNDIDTREYGINVTGTTVFDTPTRSYTQTSVPGRYGDIFSDNYSYSNLTITYHCNISRKDKTFWDVYRDFRNALVQSSGYCRLEDSYSPDIYREGVFNASLSPQAIGAGWVAGEFDVSISCKPQIWFKELTMSCSLSPVIKAYFEDGGTIVLSDTYRTLTLITIDASVNINLRLRTPAACTVYVRQYTSSLANINKTTCSLTTSAPVASISADADTRYIAMYWKASELNDNALTVVAAGKLLETVTNDGPVVNNETGYQIYPQIEIDRNYSFSTACEFYVGDMKFKVNNMSSVKKIIVDSESQTITDGDGESANSLLAIYDGDDFAYDFPVLEPGETVIKTAGYLDVNNSTPRVAMNFRISGTARAV